MATKVKKKNKMRILLVVFACFAISFYVMYGIMDTLKEVAKKEEEKVVLGRELTVLKEKNEELKVEVTKLHDKEYIARYAREKYLYSGKNEYSG